MCYKFICPLYLHKAGKNSAFQVYSLISAAQYLLIPTVDNCRHTIFSSFQQVPVNIAAIENWIKPVMVHPLNNVCVINILLTLKAKLTSNLLVFFKEEYYKIQLAPVD